MKKLFLSILVICSLLSGNAYANLFNTKTYAKCKYQSQTGKINLNTANFQTNSYVEYFAFDKEFFYFKYNVANKDFDTKRFDERHLDHPILLFLLMIGFLHKLILG